MTDSASRLPRTPGRVAALCTLAFFVLSTLWALASPLMSVPDEQAHTIRAAAVVRGQFEGTPSATEPWLSVVQVPASIANSQELRCFVGDANATASCQHEPEGDPTRLVKASTTATSNSPGFYLIAGLPSLVIDGTPAMYAMRILMALVSSTFLGLAVLAVLHLPRRRWTLLALLTACTPMVLYLAGSLNPNGVEVAASAALFATLVALVSTESSTAQLWTRSAVVAVSAIAVANTRSIGLLWVLLILIASLLLARRDNLRTAFSHPSTWAGVAVSFAGIIAAAIWYLTPHGLADQPPYAGAGTSALEAVQTMLDRTIDYGLGWIGYFGWLDRPAPALTVAIWTAALVVLLIGGARFADRRHRGALALLALSLVAVPVVVQTLVVGDLGYIWQGRYTLALCVVLVITAGMAVDSRFAAPSRAVLGNVPIAIALLAIGHVAAFAWALRRYVVGADRTWTTMLLHPAWQPPLGWIALVILYAATCGAIAIVLSRRLSAQPETTS